MVSNKEGRVLDDVYFNRSRATKMGSYSHESVSFEELEWFFAYGCF